MESNFEVVEEFDSAAACFQHLLNRYPQDATERVWLEESHTHLVLPHSAPRILFRGECGRFSETRPKARRLEAWMLETETGERVRLSPVACWEFQRLSEWLLQRFCQGSDYGLSGFEALAVQQHYGLPTVMLDLTANLGTAMTFTIGGSKDKEYYGRICVLPTESYRNGLMVGELVEHRWALRARRQHGFGIVSGRGSSPDLKSRAARKRWGIEWYEFRITEQDRQISAARYDALISVRDDPTAGILRHLLIEYVESFGKLSDDLAKWLVNLIPMVPLAYKGIGFSQQETLVEHVAPSETVFDEEREREQTLRYLSKVYPDDSRHRVRDWVPVEIGDVWADPRTLHHPY